jgi:ribA/ribD-fused uncharacterized protein
MGLSRRKYRKKDCVTFKSTKGKYGSLSNMAPNFPVFINDLLINNVEVLYQSLRYPDFPEIQQNILKHNSPISAKQYARQFIEKTRNDWDDNRFKIMKFCIQVKYYYNQKTFGDLLLQTNNLSIVEFTFEDKVWGATDDGEFYEGTNALGRLLMELRENIKNNHFKLEVPNIDNLKLIGKEINQESFNKYSR